MSMKPGIQPMMLALLLCHVAAAQMLPPIPTNMVPMEIEPPANVVPVTDIVVSWQPYTNAWFELQGSTNLVDWYFKTNMPIWTTNITIPKSQTLPMEVFRAKTMINVSTN